jgi:hypothetical protein
MGLNWLELNPFLISLVKSNNWGTWSTWEESGVRSLFVDNPVEVTGSSVVSLLGPLDFIRFVVLVIGPGVVSLGVWADVGVAVLGWIG